MLRPSGCRESVPLEWGEARVGDGERQGYGDVGRHPRSAPRVALGCRPRRGYGLPPKMFLRQSSHHARQYRHGPRDHQPRRAVEGEEPLLQVDVIPLPSDYPVKTSRNNSNNNNNNDREYNSENDETKSREIPIFEFLFLFFVSSPSVTKHWEIRNIPPRTPTTSTGIDSSITDEIWTSANEAKFFRTSTTSTGIGSSLNLHENNRSLESRDADFYSTDIEDSKDTYRRFFPNTPTTSGLGSSSDRQSVETRRGSKDLPDHLWAAAMEDGFSRFNAMKSLQTITRQPRPNHDWVKTERISRFTKHRTIGQSPQREEEIWTSKLNESNVSTYATQRMNGPHKCHHQTRRSFSTSIVADLAVTPDGSQQSLGSGEFLVSFLCLSRCCLVDVVPRTAYDLRLNRSVFIISTVIVVCRVYFLADR